MRYIEAQIADIALANELAHEVLGRTLDELPPQTRKLLALLVSLGERACAAQSVRRADYRFSRRQVREAPKWGDTQLKIHLARLVELEYLLIHRGGRGQSFEYELLYDGDTHGAAAHVSGLIDVEALGHYDAERSGVRAPRSEASRGTVGGVSAGGRVPETLYSTGIRRSELIHLKLYDIDLKNGSLLVRQGKGQKDRYVPLGSRAL